LGRLLLEDLAGPVCGAEGPEPNRFGKMEEASQEPEYAIEINNLVTHYGSRIILNGINLKIHRGETMVILGGSGCGKSTLLRHIIGLNKPTSGNILIKGQDITQLAEDELNILRTKMGVLFQGSALFNSMTIAENVALPLVEHTDLNESTIQIMVRMKLSQVGLSGFDDYVPSQLSGGMKKRAGLARALAMDPEILFFDEPSAGLDPIVSAALDELIIKLKRAFKMTIVVVTHEMASAFLIADRITVLDKGGIVALGTPEEIRNSDHPRVRQFLDRRPDELTHDSQEYLDILVR
jgi:phospholipid/cholesterol/gamma-HCH transport system ATP-binding protein